MIIFLHKDRHSYTHTALIGEEGVGEILCKNYSWVVSRNKLPKATYIFTDRERMDLWELRVYGALFQHLKDSGEGYRVINDPSKMMNRSSLLRALYIKNINDFNAYLLTEKRFPDKYPVFLRRGHDHARPLTGLLKNELELKEALAKLHQDREPDDGILVTEFCSEPVEGTLFRKLSCYQVDTEIFFYNCIHEHSWLVKYATKNPASNALYEEEQEMIVSNAFENEIRKVFEVANIEYGKVDFGLVNGKVQIYEINTNPMARPPKDHSNPTRKKNQVLGWEKYRKALTALDTTDILGPFASRFKHPDLFIPKKPLKLLFKDPLRFMKLSFCKASSKPIIRR